MPYDITDALRDIQLLDAKITAIVDELVKKKILSEDVEDAKDKSK